MIEPGTRLGRYRVVDRIASGGMSVVWRCVDETLVRTVAVKVMLPTLVEQPGFIERFVVEARTLAAIDHPGVVDIYDIGTDPTIGVFMVMKYIDGESLHETLKRHSRLIAARTMALVAQAADALQAAHDMGVVHRDVKPGNLLVHRNGTLVLTDFGIARSMGSTHLTNTGTIFGTASYMSPEQAEGKAATTLSDIYSLGVVAYQCLAGHVPFTGDNSFEVAMRHARDNPPPLPKDVPPAARKIVERAMAKAQASRWQTAAELAQVAWRSAIELAPNASWSSRLLAQTRRLG